MIQILQLMIWIYVYLMPQWMMMTPLVPLNTIDTEIIDNNITSVEYRVFITQSVKSSSQFLYLF